MIVRTVTAECDRPHCDRIIKLRSDGSQPFLELRDAKWDTIVVDDGILTLCPRHKTWRPS